MRVYREIKRESGRLTPLGNVRCRLLPAEHAAGRMSRVSGHRGILSIRAIKSFLKVDGDWQAVIGNHFAESCNRFVPFARLKLRFNSLLGPHDDCSRSMNNGVIGRPNRRVSICKRPQILVLVHRERSERRDGGDRRQPCGAPGCQGNQPPGSEPGNGDVPLLANGRYTPPIVLQKSFCTNGQKFCGLQARFSCKDVRGPIASR